MIEGAIKMKGFFDNITKEYVIQDMKPRRRLLNYLWNEEVVCQCDQFGNGFSWLAIDTQRRDIERGERNLYIKDRETGEFYSANRNYENLPFERHEAHVGLGYHTVVSEYKGLKTTFTILVPVKGHATLFSVELENTSAEEKKLSAYFAIMPKPALTWHDACGYADYSDEIGGLIYHHDGFALPNNFTKIFVGSDKKCTAWETSWQRFKGEYDGYHSPIAL